MTRAKDISKIITDADFSGTLDVTGAVTAGSVSISDDNNYSFGDGTTYIQGSGAADRLKFITNASEAMRIDSSGKVGIGTSSPQAELHLYTSSSPEIRLTDTTNTVEANFFANDSVGTIGSKSNHAFAFNTNNTERMRIDSSGNVGIGELNPVAKTHIQGSGTSGQTTASLILENSSSGTAGMDITGSAGSSRLRFLYGGGPNTGTNTLTEAINIVLEGSNAGNVGIGTSSPNAKLDIKDDSNSVQAILRGRSSDNFGILDFRNNAGDTVKGQIKSDASNRLIFRSGPSTDVMYLNSSGNVGIGNSAPYDVRVHITGDSIDEDPTLGSPTGALIVSNTATAYGMQMGVSSGGEGWIQQGRVDGTATAYSLNLQPVGGNVGIGTSSPNGNGILTLNAPTNNSPQIVFTENDTAKWLIGHRHDGDHFRFYDLANSAERMRISSNGHVSVGTTDNTYGFNVGGSGSDVRGKFQGSNQYRLGLQNGTNDIVWLGSGGANNFRISNASGQTRFEIDSNGVVKNTDFIIPFPAGQAPAGTFTHYNNGSQQSTDASHGNLPMSCNLTVKAIYLYVNSALSSGSATVQIIKNGVAVATINVTTGTNAFNSTGLSISFSAGERMGIKIIGTSTSAAWYNVSVLCERA